MATEFLAIPNAGLCFRLFHKPDLAVQQLQNHCCDELPWGATESQVKTTKEINTLLINITFAVVSHPN